MLDYVAVFVVNSTGESENDSFKKSASDVAESLPFDKGTDFGTMDICKILPLVLEQEWAIQSVFSIIVGMADVISDIGRYRHGGRYRRRYRRRWDPTVYAFSNRGLHVFDVMWMSQNKQRFTRCLGNITIICISFGGGR